MAKELEPVYAIEVQDVHKKFKIYYDKGRTLKERLLFRNRNRSEERWVLQGIDFKVKKGEAIGLIGENGAGKSTMLKLMTRIIYPDQGSITMRGRVSSLIELGAGFHPDMSGRENIYTNASIFGLTRKEIDDRLQDIIDFSELEEFIDNPVRTYSSGMYMRLAFAVAINVDADILLIDEILAVGDAAFQAKCFHKLREIKAAGTTIVIVSHSLGQIEQICDRSIWFKDGVIEKQGIPYDVHPYYLDFMGRKQFERAVSHIGLETIENESFFTETIILDEWKNEKSNIQAEDIVLIKIIYHGNFPKKTKQILLKICREDSLYCTGIYMPDEKIAQTQQNNFGEITLKIDRIALLSGEYYIDLLFYGEQKVILYQKEKTVRFSIYTSKNRDEGIFSLRYQWFFD